MSQSNSKEATKALVVRCAEKSVDVLAPFGIQPEAFSRMALNAMLINPNIAKCTPASLRRVLMECAESGLIPDGKRAVIVPRGQTATLMKMYPGLTELVRHAVPGITIRSDAVLDGDEFIFENGLEPVLKHTPAPGRDYADNEITAAWVIAEIPDGGTEIEVMWKADLDAVRSLSRSDAWSKWPGEMAKKTVLKRLLKRLPTRAPINFDDYNPEQEIEGESAPVVIQAEGTNEPVEKPVMTIEAVPEEEPAPEPKPKPKAKAKPKAKPAPEPAPEPEPEPEPAPEEEPPPSDDDYAEFV